MNRNIRIKLSWLLIITIAIIVYVNSQETPTLNREVFTENSYTMKTENSFILPDGRTLGYAEYGAPQGEPVFYFHGGQESRLSSMFMDSTAHRLGVRIIAPDRPGVGLSSFQENRSFLGWAKDIEHLADHLELQTFSVFGLSGGAPHVLACAHSFPERLKNVTIVSGTGPHNYKGKLKGIWFPVKMMHWFASSNNDKYLRSFITSEYEVLKEKPEKRLRQLQKYLPKSDRTLLKEHPSYGIEFIKGSLEAYKQGIEGVVQEWKLYVRDWDVPLSEITTHIDLWYGDEDKMAPHYRGLHYTKILQDSKLYVLENEGHFSLIRNHLEEILIKMTEAN